MRGLPRSERDVAVSRVAGMLQIEHLLDRKPAQLSGGQRQRVAMGRALVRNPRIFLFDEPLSNLDAALRVDVRTEIKRLHQRLSATVVYVTHDQAEAMALATRIAVLKDGVVQQYDAPRAIYDKPANLFVAGFIGAPPMNVMPATVAVDEGRIGLMVRNKVNDLWTPVFLPLPGRDLTDRIGRDVLFGLRPEMITCGGPGFAIESHVSALESTGADTLATIALGGKGVLARLRPLDAPHEDTTAKFTLDLDHASLFDAETGLRL